MHILNPKYRRAKQNESETKASKRFESGGVALQVPLGSSRRPSASSILGQVCLRQTVQDSALKSWAAVQFKSTAALCAVCAVCGKRSTQQEGAEFFQILR